MKKKQNNKIVGDKETMPPPIELEIIDTRVKTLETPNNIQINAEQKPDKNQTLSEPKPDIVSTNSRASLLWKQFKTQSQSKTGYELSEDVLKEVSALIKKFSNKRQVLLNERLREAKKILTDADYALTANETNEYWQNFFAEVKTEYKTYVALKKQLQTNNQSEGLTTNNQMFMKQYKNIVNLVKKNSFIISFYNNAIILKNNIPHQISDVEKRTHWIDFYKNQKYKTAFTKAVNKALKTNYSKETVNKVLAAMYNSLNRLTKWFYSLEPIVRRMVKFGAPGLILMFLLLGANKYYERQTNQIITDAETTIDSIDSIGVLNTAKQMLPKTQIMQAGVSSVFDDEIYDKMYGEQLDFLIAEWNRQRMKPAIYPLRAKRIKFWIMNELAIPSGKSDKIYWNYIKTGSSKNFDKMYVR